MIPTWQLSIYILLPSLFKAYDEHPLDSLKVSLREPVRVLKLWDRQASASSVATTLAVEWAYRLSPRIPVARTTEEATNAIGNYQRMAELIPASDKLSLLAETVKELEKLFGTWNMAWGDVNRFQRSDNNQFSDEMPSIPVGLGPGVWGSLPSFNARRAETKKRYGISGNSFVAAVEFGKRLKAKTIMTGGESFNPASKHFTDQASGFVEGKFKDINFYREDVLKKAERTYHPGE
jgi:acyl-homoserine-lactone acylase